jgi:hypothetical protein
MSAIQIEIQGQAAAEVAEELAALEGFNAECQPAETELTREISLATVVTVLSIAKTTLEIAKLIYDWYARHQPQGKIEKVILTSRSGKRINLKNARVEDIKKLLDS